MISNFKFQISNFQKGFTMVELIITIAIFSFGIVGVYAAFSPIVAANYNISARFTAAYLAQEGLEIVRNIRDINFISPGGQWADGLLNCQLGCQGDYKTGTPGQDQLSTYEPTNVLRLDGGGLYGYAAGTSTPFTRKITITQVFGDSDILKIDSTVFWSYGGQQYNFQAEGYLYNWF